MTKRSQPAEGSGRPGRGAVRLQRANLRGGRTEHAGQRCVHGHRRSPGRHHRTDRHDRRWRFHNLSVSVAQLIRVDRGGFRRPCLSSASQRSSGGRSAGARRVMVLFTAARRRGSRSGGFAWAYGPNDSATDPCGNADRVLSMRRLATTKHAFGTSQSGRR